MSPNLLEDGEVAVSGQQCPSGSTVLCDAVFAKRPDGRTRLIAYVEGAHIAEFFTRCLNEVPTLVFDLHSNAYKCVQDEVVERRARAFMKTLTYKDLGGK